MEQHPPPSDDETVIVALSRRDVDAARRFLGRLAEQASESLQGGDSLDGRERLLKRAKALHQDRLLRLRKFGPSLFGEPAWDMLLILYVELNGVRMTAGALAERSGAAKSTALRWIDVLVHRGLVNRDQHPTDRRTSFVQISAAGREKLEEYLSQACGTGVD